MVFSSHTKNILLILLFVAGTVNFTRTTLQIIRNSKRLDSISQEVSQLTTRRDALEDEIAYKKTDDFVEEMARNKLSLVKPGESVFVVTDNNINAKAMKKSVEDALGAFTSRIENKDDGSYLDDWLKLLF